MQEERRRIAREILASLGRIDHPVLRRRQDAIGQARQHVADIADDAVGGRGDRQPLAVAVEQLQAGLLGAEQQGDDIDVAMGAGAHAFARPVDRRIVQEAQHRIAEIDLVGEKIAVELEIDGDRLQHLFAEIVEGGIERVAGGVEVGDLDRPDIVGHVVAVGVIGRQVAADVIEFLEVMGGVALGGFDAERRVAARPALAFAVILPFDVLGQGEKGPGRGIDARQQRRIDAVAAQHREAVTFERCAEPCRKGLEILIVQRQRHRRNGGRGDSGIRHGSGFREQRTMSGIAKHKGKGRTKQVKLNRLPNKNTTQ